MRFANEFGFCELNPFPGCGQIIVSNHAFIYPSARGKGLGTLNHEKRLQRMKDMGYDLALCTVRVGNVAQIRILKKMGWEKLIQFHNTETGHLVDLWAKRLK